MFQNQFSLQIQGLLDAFYPGLRQRGKVAERANDLIFTQKTQLEDRTKMQAKGRVIIIIIIIFTAD